MYSRKVQKHGTGREIHIPPEICKGLGITEGDDIEFDLEPGDNVVTLCKAGASDNRQDDDDSDESGIGIVISFED